MKKLFPLIAMILFFGCQTDITERLDNLESRMAALEELCSKMNTNISSLQSIVSALQNKDYITAVTPITENDVGIGYTITFTKSKPITIYHGKDGEDGKNGTNGADGKDGVDGKGHTSVIGVRQDSDGIYY